MSWYDNVYLMRGSDDSDYSEEFASDKTDDRMKEWSSEDADFIEILADWLCENENNSDFQIEGIDLKFHENDNWKVFFEKDYLAQIFPIISKNSSFREFASQTLYTRFTAEYYSR